MHKLKQINVDEPRLLPVLETKRADDVPSRIRRKAKNKTKSSTGDILKQGLTALPVKVTPGDMAIRKAANHHIFMGFNASNVNLDGNDISLPYSSSSTKSNRININRNYNNINRLNQELNAVELTPSALMYDEGLGHEGKRNDNEGGVGGDTGSIRSFSNMMDQYSLHNFIVWRGRVQETTPEYISFRRTYEHIWKSIAMILNRLEIIVQKEDMKMVVLNGSKVAELAKLYISMNNNNNNQSNNNQQIPDQIIYDCIMSSDHKNHEMIMSNLRRGLSSDSASQSALRMQTSFRGYKARKDVLERRRKSVAVIPIQAMIRRYLELCRLPRRMAMYNKQQKELWSTLQSRLSNNNNNNNDDDGDGDGNNTVGLPKSNRSRLLTLTNRSRLLVIVPSFSAPEVLRIHLEHYRAMENAILPSIHMLRDPNLHLAYVLPFQVPSHQIKYFEYLLSLLGISLVGPRLHFIFADMCGTTSANIPLAQALWYSRSALLDIKSLLKRCDHGLLLASQASWAERRICCYLSLSLLASDSSKWSRLSSRSFMREIFSEADANFCVGYNHIYSMDDLLVALSGLVAKHPDISCWRVNLNSESQTDAPMSISLSKLGKVRQILKDHGPLYSSDSKQVHIELRKTLLDVLKPELPRAMNLHGVKHCSDLQTYLALINSQGAVIEAYPNTAGKEGVELSSILSAALLDSDGRLVYESSMDVVSSSGGNGNEMVYVSPDMNAVSTGSKDRNVTGILTNTPLYLAVRSATAAICQVLYNNYGFYGHVTVKYLRYIDPIANIPQILAVDLRFGYSKIHSSLGFSGTLADSTMNKKHTASSSSLGTTATNTTNNILSNNQASTTRLNLTNTNTPNPNPTDPSTISKWSSYDPLATVNFNGQYTLYIPLFIHNGLNKTRDDIFFKTCNLNGIGYDRDKKQGTFFFALDNSIASGRLAILIVGGTRRKVIDLAVDTLSFFKHFPYSGTEENPFSAKLMILALKKLRRKEEE